MQARRGVLEILAEPLHDSDGVARNSVIGRPCAQAGQSEDGKKDDRTQADTTRQDLLESILSLPDQILNIRTAVGPAAPGAATAVVVLRPHLNVLLSCRRDVRSRSSLCIALTETGCSRRNRLLALWATAWHAIRRRRIWRIL